MTHVDRLLLRILDSVPNPLFVKDAAHRWILVNDAWEAFTGLPRDAVMGYTETLYPEYRKKIRATYRQPPPCKDSCGQAGNFVRRRAQ